MYTEEVQFKYFKITMATYEALFIYQTKTKI